MASPEDWNKVGLDGNPVPGNPDSLDATAGQLRGLRDLADEVDRGLDSVLRTSGNGGFEGETADALRGYIHKELKTFTANVHRSFDMAASAVDRYAKALRDAQGRADGAARRAGEVAVPPAGLVGKNAPPPAELTAAKNDVEAEVDFITTEAKILEDALNEASDLVSRPVKRVKKSFWKKFWQALEIIGMVLAVVALIVGGGFGIAAFLVGAVLLAKAVADFATGKTNALGLGLALLGVLFPSTKGLTTLTGALRMLKAGGKLLSGGARAGLSLGRAFLQGGRLLLLAPGTFAGLAGQNLLRVARGTGMVISALPGAAGSAFRLGRNMAVGTARQFVGGLGRDFARTTRFVGGGGLGLRLGVFAIIALPRVMANAFLPLKYFEISKFGWGGAFRMGIMERGFHVPLSARQSLGRVGNVAGNVTSLRAKDPLAPGSGKPFDDVTAPHLVVPGTQAWNDAIDDLSELLAPPPVTPGRSSGISSLSPGPGGIRAGMPAGTPGRIPAVSDSLLERLALNDLDAAGVGPGGLFQRQGLDTLGTFRSGPLSPQMFRMMDNLLHDLDQLGKPVQPGRLLLQDPDNAVVRLEELDQLMGLERTGTGLLKPFDDLSDLAALSIDGKLGGLNREQLLKILDGEIDLVTVTSDGVILRVGKTDPVDVHVGLKGEVTVRVLDPREAGAGLPTFLSRIGGPGSPAGPGIKLDDLAGLIPDTTTGLRQARELLGLGPTRTDLAVKPVMRQAGFPPVTLREIVTGGAVGRTATDRFQAWVRLQSAETDLDTAGRQLTRLTELPDTPPLSRAQAELDLSAAELNLNQARIDFGRLGMNPDVVRQDITVMMARFEAPTAGLPAGELRLLDDLGQPTDRWITLESGANAEWVLRTDTGVVPDTTVRMVDDGFLVTAPEGVFKVGPEGTSVQLLGDLPRFEGVHLSGSADLTGLRLVVTELPATEVVPASFRIEVADFTTANTPVRLPDLAVTAREGGGFTVTGADSGVRWQFDGAEMLEFRELPVPGTDLSLRFGDDVMGQLPQVVGPDGLPVTSGHGAEFVRTADEGLTVRMPVTDAPGATMAEFRFDLSGTLLGRDVPLTGHGVDVLSGMSLRLAFDPGVTGTVLSRELVGGGFGTRMLFRVDATPSSLTGRLGEGVTLTETVGGRVLHFDNAGQLRVRDVPDGEGGFLRFEGTSGTATLRLDASGTTVERLAGTDAGLDDAGAVAGGFRPMDFQATDVRLADFQTTDVRPTGVQPTDVRPADFQTTNALPTDIQTTDARPADFQTTDTRPTDFPSVDFQPLDFGGAPQARFPLDSIPENALPGGALGERFPLTAFPEESLREVSLSAPGLEGLRLRVTEAPASETLPAVSHLELVDSAGLSMNGRMVLEQLDGGGFTVVDTVRGARWELGPRLQPLSLEVRLPGLEQSLRFDLAGDRLPTVVGRDAVAPVDGFVVERLTDGSGELIVRVTDAPGGGGPLPEWRFDNSGLLREARLPVTGPGADPALRGLSVRVVHTPATDMGAGGRTFELVGSSRTSLTVAPLTGEPARRLPGGFSLTDEVTGLRWHADGSGRIDLSASVAEDGLPAEQLGDLDTLGSVADRVSAEPHAPVGDPGLEPLPELEHIFQGTLREASAVRPETAPTAMTSALTGGRTDLASVRGLDDFFQLADEVAHAPRTAPGVMQVERLAVEAQAVLHASGFDTRLLHEDLRGLRSSALAQVTGDARQALDAHLTRTGAFGPDGRPFDVDFSVTPEWGGGHSVVHHLTDLRMGFDDQGRLVSREFPLHDVPAELVGVKVVAADSVTGEGLLVREFTVVETPEVAGRFVTEPVGPELERAGARFSVVDGVTGNRFFFAPEGTLIAGEVRLGRSLGVLRLDMSAAGRPPQVLGRAGVPVSALRAETVGGGRVALTPVGESLTRPLQRVVIDSRSLEVAEKTVGVPGPRGELTGEYWKVDYTSGTAVRLDAAGRALTGRLDTAAVRLTAGGEFSLVGSDGRILFESSGPGRTVAAVDRTVDPADIAPAEPAWRTTDEPLWRYDDRRPEMIYRDGFRPKDPAFLDLGEYVRENTPSGFVSTTVDSSLEWGSRYKYEIHAPGGIDVNKTFDKDYALRIDGNPFAHEAEISFAGGVRARFIKGAYEWNGYELSAWKANPTFRPAGAEQEWTRQSTYFVRAMNQTPAPMAATHTVSLEATVHSVVQVVEQPLHGAPEMTAGIKLKMTQVPSANGAASTPHVELVGPDGLPPQGWSVVSQDAGLTVTDPTGQLHWHFDSQLSPLADDLLQQLPDEDGLFSFEVDMPHDPAPGPHGTFDDPMLLDDTGLVSLDPPVQRLSQTTGPSEPLAAGWSILQHHGGGFTVRDPSGHRLWNIDSQMRVLAQKVQVPGTQHILSFDFTGQHPPTVLGPDGLPVSGWSVLQHDGGFAVLDPGGKILWNLEHRLLETPDPSALLTHGATLVDDVPLAAVPGDPLLQGHAVQAYHPAGMGPGSGVSRFELVGPAADRFAVRPVDAALERLGARFSVLSHDTGNLFHFGPGGSPVGVDLWLGQDMGIVRLALDGSGRAPETLTSMSTPATAMRADELAGGRIAVGPVGGHLTRPRQHVVIDSHGLEVVEKTVGIPATSGNQPGRYWRVDYHTRTAVTLDEAGLPLPSGFDPVRVDLEPNGEFNLLGENGDLLYASTGPGRLLAASDLSVDLGRLTPDRAVWRKTDETLWRNDNRGPETIFNDGFRPRDPANLDLGDFITANTPSSFVSTTVDSHLGWGSKFRYEIHAPGGIDANETFRINNATNPFANEAEITFVGGVHTRFIRRVEHLHEGQAIDQLDNPAFHPVAGDEASRRAATYFVRAMNQTPQPMAVTRTMPLEETTGTVRPVVQVTEEPLHGAPDLAGTRFRLTQVPRTRTSTAFSHLELVGPDGLPVPGRRLLPREGGGFTVTGGARGDLHFGAGGGFELRDVRLPGIDHTLRFDTPAGVDSLPKLLDKEGAPVAGALIRRSVDGGLTVDVRVPWQEETRLRWQFAENGELTGQSVIAPDRLAVAVDRSVDVDGIRPKDLVAWRDAYEPLWRYDNRLPKVVFKEGFAPRDPAYTDLKQLVDFNRRSAFVSTTSSPDAKFAMGRFRYEIHAPGGIDADASLKDLHIGDGLGNPHQGEFEISFPGGIRPQFIKGAHRVVDPQGAHVFSQWKANRGFDPTAVNTEVAHAITSEDVPRILSEAAAKAPVSGPVRVTEELERFARTFGKMTEREARRLWDDASAIISRFDAFPLVIDVERVALLKRDPLQYWHTMRVAQELHLHAGDSERLFRGIDVARDLAKERGADGLRQGLAGGSPGTLDLPGPSGEAGPSRVAEDFRPVNFGGAPQLRFPLNRIPEESLRETPLTGAGLDGLLLRTIEIPADGGLPAATQLDLVTPDGQPVPDRVLIPRQNGGFTVADTAGRQRWELGPRLDLLTRDVRVGDGQLFLHFDLTAERPPTVVGPDGLPVPDRVVLPHEDGGFTVPDPLGGDLRFGSRGHFESRELRLPGTEHVVRFDTPAGTDGTPRLLDRDGSPVPGADAVRAGDGGLTVRMPAAGDLHVRWQLNPGGRLMAQEIPLTGHQVELLAGVGLRLDFRPGVAGADRTVVASATLAGGGFGAVAAFRIQALPEQLAGPLGNGFTLAERAVGRAFHFEATGLLRFRDVPYNGGILRFEAGATPTAPQRIPAPQADSPVRDSGPTGPGGVPPQRFPLDGNPEHTPPEATLDERFGMGAIPEEVLRETPLTAPGLDGLRLRITEVPTGESMPSVSHVELVGPDGLPVPDRVVLPREDGGFTITDGTGRPRWELDAGAQPLWWDQSLTQLAVNRLTPFDDVSLYGVGELAGQKLRLTHVAAPDGTSGSFRLNVIQAPPTRSGPGAGPQFKAEQIEDGGFRVTDPAGTTRWEFDAGGGFVARETALVDHDLGLPSDLWFRVTNASVTPDGATTRFVGLVGRDGVPSSVSGSFRLAPVDRTLRVELPDGFTLTDTVTGGRFHFDADGTLAFRDRPTRDGSGFLRFTEGAPDIPPARIDDPGDVSGTFTDGSQDDLTQIFHRMFHETSGGTGPIPDTADLLPRLDPGPPDRTLARLGPDHLPELNDQAIWARLDEYWQTVLDAAPGIRLGVDDLADFEIRVVRVPSTDTAPGSFRLELVNRAPASDSTVSGADFTVQRTADGEHIVTDPAGTTSWWFSEHGHFLGRETVLTGDELPADLRLSVAVVTEADGTARTAIDLLGPSGAVNSVRLAPAEGALAGQLPGGFTLTDTVTGSRFHFDNTGRLAFRDLPDRDGTGFLRFTEGADTAPTRLVEPPADGVTDMAQIFQRNLDEASGAHQPEGAAQVPEGAPTDLSGITGAMDLLHHAPDSHAFQTLSLPRVQQLGDAATESLNRLGLGPELLHDQLRGMTAQAYQAIRQGAASALREYLGLPSAARLQDLHSGVGRTVGDFTVVQTPHGGPGGSHYTVTHTGTDLSSGFGPNGTRLSQEVFLRGGPDGLDGVRLRMTGRTAEGGHWAPDSFEFVGARPADGSLTVTGLAPNVPAQLRGGFTLLDPSGVTRWHYGPEGMVALRDVRLPGDRGLLRFDAAAPNGVPQALDTAGLASPTLRVERLDDGRIALIPTGTAAHPLERAVFDTTGGTLLDETLAIRGGSGRPTGEFWKIDHVAGTAVRTDVEGTPFTSVFDTATVERSGTGQFRLVGTSPGKVTLFEREVLGSGNTLHVDVSRSGHARWTEFDGAGSRFRHGERLGDVDQHTVHDVPSGSWRVLNNVDVRTYTKALDGGLVRAEKGADGHWTWQRFGKDGTEVLSGDRDWSWNHVAFKDTYLDPATGIETVAQRRGQTWPFGGLHGSRMYQEHAVLPGLAPAGGRIDPGDYTGFHPANAQIERMEGLSDGGSLLVKRFADMRPPAFFWKSAAGRNPFDGFFSDLFTGESLNRVSFWTETAADGTQVTGVRLNPTGSNWADFDQYGRLVRENRKLENGQVIEVGRSAEDPTKWAPVPEYRNGGSYELHWTDTTTGRTGTRHVDGNGRWRDLFTDEQGVERIRLRSEGKGTREYLHDAPSTEDLRLDDDTGFWVDKNSQQHVSGRRDLVDGKIVESSGSPYRTRWTWKAYDPSAPDTVIGEGIRTQNRGSVYSRPWDDSFKDFDTSGNLLRERSATDTGSSWVDAVKQDDGTWKWTRRAADGAVHSEGVRVYDDIATGRWRDLVDDQEVRRVVGDRVREYQYEIVVPPPTAPPRGGTLASFLADSIRHFEPPTTVRVDPDLWKEYDAGKVFRERVGVDGIPSRHRVVDKQWGQWVEFQSGHLVQWRTVEGRVWKTDAFGRMSTSGPLPGGGARTLIGREADFRGMDAEIMGRLREIQDVWHGRFTGVRDGDAVEMPMWQRELRSGLTALTTGFVTDFTTSLAITAATNNGDVTRTDVYKALLSGAVGGTFNGGLNVLYNQTRLGWLKTRMGTMDWGGHPNQTQTTVTDDWATDFTAQEKATRWRNATYSTSAGLATGALSFFISNAAGAAIFGVNGREVKGWDAMEAGAWAAGASLFSGVTTGLARNVWHLSTGARVFHKGGVGELGMNWAESALARYLAYLITQADKDNGNNLPSPSRPFPKLPAPPSQPLTVDQSAPLTEHMELP
ncbi:putative T7SS-secreted protein [Streptomyces sp. NPDC050619]|uniref:scabin-related ADP-ribosyltransferase n=1 Tax=Streptomyces sp. NPDC050619 TaxID=3157214 RepID=UPI003434320F